MSNYQSALDLINLRYGALNKHVYGGVALPMQGAMTNQHQYQKMKNKINYGYNFDILLNHGSQVREV